MVNVLGGVVVNFLINHYFFDGHLNGNRYLEFFNNALPELPENVPYPNNMSIFLNYQFSNLPRKSCAMSCEIAGPCCYQFLLQGFVKNNVFKEDFIAKQATKQNGNSIYKCNARGFTECG